MNKFMIAKNIVKIARMLVAEDENDNEKFFNSVVKAYSFDGFVSRVDEDDEISFIFKGDDTEGSYIVFGESEGEWGYTVFIGGDESIFYEAETCEDAFSNLKPRINTFLTKMQKYVEDRDRVVEKEEIIPMGECTVSKVEDDGTFNFKDNPFRYMYDSYNEEVYEIVFIPNAGVGKRDMSKSITNVNSEISSQMNTNRKRGSNLLRFWAINSKDVDFVNDVLKNNGWTVKNA